VPKVFHFADADRASHIARPHQTGKPYLLFQKIHHTRTADAIEKQIESLILEGILRVGDRLPGERDLAAATDVSRPVVREALAALEARGLLETRHGGGTYVADIIGTVFAVPVVELIGSNAKAKADYLEYRREIEAVTASFAAQRATNADKALLTRIIKDMQAAHAQANSEWEARVDVEFHTVISDCTHNVIVLHTLRSCYRLLADDVFFNRSMIYQAKGSRDALLEQHLAIYEAIMDGDAERARNAATEHINFIERVMREVERKGDWDAIAELRLTQRDSREKETRKRASKPVAR